MMAQNEVVVVGIDVAKDKVDACIRSLSQRQTFPSTAEGRRALIRWLRKHKVGKAVMEATGGYERDWAKALREARIEVRIVDPKRVRSFARSAGRLAKNDAIDAEMIARFAETFDEARGQAYDAAREELVQIVNARQALLEQQTQMQNRCEHTVPIPVRKMHERLLKAIALEVAKLEAAIAALIKASPHFAETAEIIESVPGLGKITSAGLIAAMPELGQVSNQAISALLGVAPYDDDSGKRQGERQIKGGRRKVRNLFYMACIGAATRHNPVLKAFYHRLIAKGKKAKGCAGRLHAQADRHSQHHDRAPREMGCQSLCGGLTSAPSRARHSAERLQAQQTGERMGSRPSAAGGRWRAAPALRPADHRATSKIQLLVSGLDSHRRS